MADEADQSQTGGKTGSTEYSLYQLLQLATQGGYAAGLARYSGAGHDAVFQAYEDNGGKYVSRSLVQLKQHLAPEDFTPLHNAINQAHLRAGEAAEQRLDFSLKASLDQPEIDTLRNLSDKLLPHFPEIQDELGAFNAPSQQHPRTAPPAEGKSPQVWGGNLNVSPAAPAPAPEARPDAPPSDISLFQLLNLSANIGYSDGVGLSQSVSRDARETVASTLGELSGRLSPADFSLINDLAGNVTERAKQAARAGENFSLKRALEESEITTLAERTALPAAFRDFQKATGYFRAPTSDHPRSAAFEEGSPPGIKAGDLPRAVQQAASAAAEEAGPLAEPVVETGAGQGNAEAKDPVVEEPVIERDDGKTPPVEPTPEQRTEKPVDAEAKPAEAPAQEPSADKGNKGLIAAAAAIVTAIAVGLGLKKGDDTNQQPASNREETARRAASTTREKIDGATGKAREGIDRALGSENADRAKALGSSLVNNFKDMSGTNKTAAVLGTGMALEGTVSAVNNIRNGGGAKRICFALGRAAVGGLMTYATYQAANQNMNVGAFAQKELQRRLGRSNTQGQGV